MLVSFCYLLPSLLLAFCLFAIELTLWFFAHYVSSWKLETELFAGHSLSWSSCCRLCARFFFYTQPNLSAGNHSSIYMYIVLLPSLSISFSLLSIKSENPASEMRVFVGVFYVTMFGQLVPITEVFCMFTCQSRKFHCSAPNGNCPSAALLICRCRLLLINPFMPLCGADY